MVRLVYESLADYLVRKRNYDGLLLDDFTTDEMQLLSRHQIVDFDNLNVKLSFLNKFGLIHSLWWTTLVTFCWRFFTNIFVTKNRYGHLMSHADFWVGLG